MPERSDEIGRVIDPIDDGTDDSVLTTNDENTSTSSGTSIVQPILIETYCCVDGGTGQCATPIICEEYLTADGICPELSDDQFITVDSLGNILDDSREGSFSGPTRRVPASQFRLIPCDPDNAERELVATTRTVTIRSSDPVGGQVSFDDNQFSDSATKEFLPGQVRNIYARSSEGWEFVNWSFVNPNETLTFSNIPNSGYLDDSERELVATFSRRTGVSSEQFTISVIPRLFRDNQLLTATDTENIIGEVSVRSIKGVDFEPLDYKGSTIQRLFDISDFITNMSVRVDARQINGGPLFYQWNVVRSSGQGISSELLRGARGPFTTSSDITLTSLNTRNIASGEVITIYADFRFSATQPTETPRAATGPGGSDEPPVETPTPTPTATPDPTPVPEVSRWRSCIDGELNDGVPPGEYVVRQYRGVVGGVCWEPTSTIGFNPSLNNVNFSYQRGSSFPAPFEFEVENPSFSTSYLVTFETNTRYFTIIPRQVVVNPREVSEKINISVDVENIEQFGDGITNFNLEVSIEEVP